MAINCNNTAPVANNDIFTVTEDMTGSVNVLNNDTDPDAGDIVVFSGVVVGPAYGSVTFSGGTGTYTPNANYC